DCKNDNVTLPYCKISMSKDANSFGHDKALAWESRGFVYTKKRMHRFDTPSSCTIQIVWPLFSI
ncbi:hypothetical protein, partial [Bacteroides acidifaciens]